MSNKALSSKNGVGWSWWPRIAQWLVLKAATGEKLELGRRLEQRVSLGLFCPNTVEARDRSTDRQAHCLRL